SSASLPARFSRTQDGKACMGLTATPNRCSERRHRVTVAIGSARGRRRWGWGGWEPAGIGVGTGWSFGVLLGIFIFQASAYAAEKIRIGFPDLAVSFVSLPLGEKRGHFREEGLQAEFIRINPTVALAALVSGEMDYYTVLAPAVAAAIRGLPI